MRTLGSARAKKLGKIARVRFGLGHLALFLGALPACQASSDAFISLDDSRESELLLLIPAVGDRVDLSRVQIVLPSRDPSSAAKIELADDESLLLLDFDHDTLRRGVATVAPLEPDQISLHPPSETECGPEGRVASPGNERITGVRQTLSRFEPKVRVLGPDKASPVPGQLAQFRDLGSVELELPADIEPCQDRIGLELVPFTEGGVFANGLGTPSDPLGIPYSEPVIGLAPLGGERWVLWGYSAISVVRRHVAFDPEVDRRFHLNDSGLPGIDQGVWILKSLESEAGAQPGTHRFLLMVRELTAGATGEKGWVLLEVPFDGDQFQTPILRWRFEGPDGQNFGGSDLARHPGGALMAVGGKGSYALTSSLDEPFIGGTYDRGDFEAAAFTDDPTRPHVLGVRGGLLGLGNLATGELEFFPGRDGAGALEFRVVDHLGEPWLYSGWKSGQTLPGRRSAATPELLPIELTVPLRAESCWDPRFERCGRYQPYAKVLGLEIRQDPSLGDLLVAVFEDCSSVLVHELGSGCTTSAEFPERRPVDASATRLMQHRGEVYAIDGEGTPFELRIVQR